MKLLTAFALLATAYAQCGWDSPNGEYDFSDHMADGTLGPESLPEPNSFYKSHLLICSDAGPSCNCFPTLTCTIPNDSAMAVKFTGFDPNPPTCSGMISKWDGGAAATWSFINDADPEEGVQAVFENGDPCYGASGQMNAATATISMCCPGAPCSGLVADTEEFHVTADSFACDWEYTVISEAACGPSGGGGLSGGWIFVMIVLIPAFVYFVVGFIYKTRTKGTSGVESIPNIDFWRDLPGLVKDGWRFTMEKVRGNNYSQMSGSGGGTDSGGF